MATTSPSIPNQQILIIDTSSSQGGIALYDGHALSTRTWPAYRSHTTTLLSEVHHLLDKARIQVGELGAIGIAIGPGAFTGLRVGIGVAKGFHLATGVPLIGVSTLEAAALSLASCGTPVIAVVAAGRGRLVWARYELGSEGLSEVTPPRNGAISELSLELEGMGSVQLTGELDDDQVREIGEIAGVSVPPSPVRARHPGALAELAWRRWQSRHFDNAEAIEPVYLSR